MGTLKDRFGMQRALYKGQVGFERHVGWCIIAHNLVAMSRTGRKSGGDRRCRSGRSDANDQKPRFQRSAVTAQPDQATCAGGHLRILIGDLSPVWKSRLPLSLRRPKARSTFIYQLPRKNRKNHRLLCSPPCRCSDPPGSSGLASTPGSFA